MGEPSLDMFGGGRVLVSGIEPDIEDDRNLTRVYVGARYKNNYVLVDDAGAEQLRREWAGVRHLFVRFPADTPIYTEEGTSNA